MTYRLSRSARQDLDEIWDYIARDNPDAATRFSELLIERFDILGRQPSIGRACGRLGSSLYRFPVGNHVILHRIGRQPIEIARVLHGARDIEAIFTRENTP